MDIRRQPTWSFDGPEVSAWSFDVSEKAAARSVDEPPQKSCWYTTKLKIKLVLVRLRHRVEEWIPTRELCFDKVTVEDDDGNRVKKWRRKKILPPVEEMHDRMHRWSLCLKFALYCFFTFVGVLAVMAVPSPWPESDEFTRCEIVRPNSLLREPTNSMSNLGYIWVSKPWLSLD